MTNYGKIENTLRAAVNSLPLWIAFGDTEGRYFFANEYYSKTFNIPIEKIIGCNFKDVFPPDLYEKHKSMYDECIKNRKSVNFEEESELGNGRKIYTCGVYTPLADRGGNIYGVSVAAYDNTEKKDLELNIQKAGEDLRISESKIKEWVGRYDCIVAASGQMAYDYDVPGGKIYCSDSVTKVLGYERSVEDFSWWAEKIHPDDRGEIMRRKIEWQNNFSFFDAIYRFRHKDGHYLWVRNRGYFLADDHGNAVRQLGMIEDVTELKKAEDAIIRAREEAEAANSAKSLFLANISHEVRTPMNGIVGFTNLLKKSGLNCTQKEFVDIIKSSCDHLLGLIDDLLDFSKIEARKIKLDSVVFDIRSAVDDSINFISEQRKAKNLDIETKVDERINYGVIGDPRRFRQIVINLLTNAIKFTPEGKIGVNISQLSLPDDTAAISVEVRDTGIGIPAEKIGEIFEMFHQLDESSTKRHGGSGIGLSIVKGLAELMGGSVAVESEVGKGSIFTVIIPFKKGS
jgi:PAS domain S-box-containing protein